MRTACRAIAALTLALAGCAPRSDSARPALWRVTGPHGAAGFLFGTIHALPRPARWRTARVESALAASDELVVEVAALDDDSATARAFAALARPVKPKALADRVAPALRPALARLLARRAPGARDLATMPSWAAAITLAQVTDAGSDTGNGIDRALLADERRAPHAHAVAELEGAARQLAIFAALPQPAQDALLAAVIAGADHADADAASLAAAWRRGDVAALARETDTGMLADPTLHEALYAARNRAWAASITRRLAAGDHPFVAVGAAHLAGAQSLPVLLAAQGFTVTRIE